MSDSPDFDPLAPSQHQEVDLLSPDDFDPLAVPAHQEVNLLGADLDASPKKAQGSASSEGFDPLAPSPVNNGGPDPFDDLLGDFGSEKQTPAKSNGTRHSSSSSSSELEVERPDLKDVIDSALGNQSMEAEYHVAEAEQAQRQEQSSEEEEDFSKARDWSAPRITEDIREETDRDGNIVQIRSIISSYPDGREEVQTERKIIRKQITEFITVGDLGESSGEEQEASPERRMSSSPDQEVTQKRRVSSSEEGSDQDDALQARNWQEPEVSEQVTEEQDRDGNTVQIRVVTRRFADGSEETETERRVTRRAITEFVSLEELERNSPPRESVETETVQTGVATYEDEDSRPYLPHYMRMQEDSPGPEPRASHHEPEGKYKTGRRWQPPPKDEDAELLLPATGPLPVYSARGTKPFNSVSAEEYEKLDIVNRDADEIRRMEEEELPPEQITRNLVQQFRNMDANKPDSSIYKTGKRWQPPPKEEGVDIPLPTSVPAVARERPVVGVSRLPTDGSQAREVVNRDDAEQAAREDEELPPQDITKGLLARFRQLEADNDGAAAPSPQRKPPPRPRTPPRENPMINAPLQLRTSAPSQSKTAAPLATSSAGSSLSGSSENVSEAQGRIAENEPVSLPDVVRETDGPPEEELPSSGLASSLLNKFKSMEVDDKPPPLPITGPKPESRAIKPTFVHVPPQVKRTAVLESPPVKRDTEPSQQQVVNEESVIQPEGGVYESEPVRRPDVISEADRDAEMQELPEQGVSRSLIAQWSERVASTHREQEEATPPRRGQPSRWNVKTTGYIGTQASIKPADAGESSRDMSYASDKCSEEPIRDTNIAENTPSSLPDVVRESDRGEDEELPTSGFARSMLKRYQETVANQAAQEEAPRRKQYVRKS